MITETARQLLDHNLLRVSLEQQLKEVNRFIVEAEQKLYDAMTDEGVDSVEVDTIKFQPKLELNFSLDGELAGTVWDNETFFNWLREQKLGDLIKMRESVHPQTRNKVLKDMAEEGKSLPPWIKQSFFQAMKYNKSAIERMALAGGNGGK